jgi:hypothetical protein
LWNLLTWGGSACQIDWQSFYQLELDQLELLIKSSEKMSAEVKKAMQRKA